MVRSRQLERWPQARKDLLSYVQKYCEPGYRSKRFGWDIKLAVALADKYMVLRTKQKPGSSEGKRE